jgi:hypothetical protein
VPLHWTCLNCEGSGPGQTLVSFDERAKISDVLDEKVSTFFLQPPHDNGGGHMSSAFSFPLCTDGANTETL